MRDKSERVARKLHFEKGQSYILYVDKRVARKKKALKPLTLEGEFEIKERVDNYITLDTLCYSTDGVNYTSPRHHMCVMDELLHKHYEGKAYLKYEVNIDTPPRKCTLLAENTNVTSLKVNGAVATKSLVSNFDVCALAYDVADMLKKGKNQIVMEINYFQKEDVYYALFGENVTESLKNCLAYDTDIEPVYLCGDFGVYGDFIDCADGRIHGENFRLGEQRAKVSELIKEGFPFFSGDITLVQNVELNDTGYALFVPEQFHIIDVTVNGKYAGRMMFSQYLDISKYLKKGENRIELTTTIGLRNLLGPFHTHREDKFVGPDTFERFGSWKDGQSRWYEPKYAFVKNII